MKTQNQDACESERIPEDFGNQTAKKSNTKSTSSWRYLFQRELNMAVSKPFLSIRSIESYKERKKK
jgi:hypothetical protein